jgi:putative membrane protein
MFKQFKTATLMTLLMFFILSIAVFGQNPPSTQDEKKVQKQGEMAAKVVNNDKDFIMKAAEDGMLEVELGQLALKQASSEDVKAFARRMVDDHTKANQELTTLAGTKAVTPPSSLDAKHKQMMDKLSKLSGAEFDREYMKAMVKDHQKAVELFERQSKSGRDTELKAWADKTLPTLREHHQMARDVAKKVGVTGIAAERQ